MKVYDLTRSHYGTDPILFIKDAFNKIAAELEPDEEATIAINPEHFAEPPQALVSLAPEGGLDVISTVKISPDEVQLQVKKRAA